MAFSQHYTRAFGNHRWVSKEVHVVVEPCSTREIEMIFKLIVKVPEVVNTADTLNPHRGII